MSGIHRPPNHPGRTPAAQVTGNGAIRGHPAIRDEGNYLVNLAEKAIVVHGVKNNQNINIKIEATPSGLIIQKFRFFMAAKNLSEFNSKIGNLHDSPMQTAIENVHGGSV